MMTVRNEIKAQIVRAGYTMQAVSYTHLTVNFRSSKKSYRDKRVKNDPSDWLIFENTHEAIVDVYKRQACPTPM